MKRCRHEPCRCVVDEIYCSPHCRSASEQSEPDAQSRNMACGCGHPGCYRQSDSSLVSEMEAPED